MTKDKIAAIHQPNFFPWLGFFNKLYRADIFVLLDNVQFPKKGGFWSNRVQILINNEASWITVPINRSYHGYKNINEIEIDNTKKWKDKLLKTIEQNYSRANYFSTVFPFISNLINTDSQNLFEFNYVILKSLIDLTGFSNKEIIIASQLSAKEKSTELLINIIKETGANFYICGAGSINYQNDSRFEEEGIKLIKQNFVHPVYNQFQNETFIPGLSIIDSLMHTGIEGTIKLISLD
jgi:hypothetical protein